MDWAAERIGVVGGGTMGAGIAICGVQAGVPTTILEVGEDRMTAARERVEAFLDKGVDRGKLSEEACRDAKAKLHVTTDMDDLNGCSAVIEAVFEDMAVKHELLGSLDAVLANDALIASNTSTLSVSQIAAGSVHPERVVGLHFCNPAPLMPLVEAVRGLRTDDQSYERALTMTAQLGKQAVRVNDTPGFFVNRFLVPFENDCIRALEAGVASVEDIDKAVRLGLGYPMGPFTLLDIVGLDIHKAVSMSLFEQLHDKRFASPPLVERMIASGHLGRKTGQGFYSYERDGMFGA